MINVTGAERTIPPPAPDMVSVYVPLITFFLELIVRVEVPALTSDEGVNVPCTNLGNPLTERVTPPEKPSPVTVTEYVVVPVIVIVLVGGVAAIEKGPTTTSVTVALWVTPPVMPLIVSWKLPVGVEAVVDTLSVVDPEVATEPGLKEAVAPVGSPVTLNATTPVNPVAGVTVAV